MPRIRCHYEDCVFLEDGYCGAAAIELEPENGCLTYTRVDEADDAKAADEWEEEDFEDDADEEGDDYYDDDDEEEAWDDEDEDY